MKRVLPALALCALSATACTTAGTELGFAVALTVQFDESIDAQALGNIYSLAFQASGDESYRQVIRLDRTVSRVERVVYRPMAGTHTLSLEVKAQDDLDKPRARGTVGPLTLEAGKTIEATVVLAADLDDLGVKPDLTLSDAAAIADGGSVAHLDGEDVEVPPGWQVSVLRELVMGTDYVYRANDFIDNSNGDQDDNHPRRVVSLVAPFADGFAVLAGRQVVELKSSGGSTLHSYTPSAPNQVGSLDRPRDLHFAQTVGATVGRLLVCGSSTGAGDSVYQINSDWVMSLVVSSNNNAAVAFDPLGLFGNRGSPEIYYGIKSNVPGTLVRVSDGQVIFAPGGPPIDDIEIESSGKLAVVAEIADDPNEIEYLGEVSDTGSGTFALHRYSSVAVDQMTLVTGAITRLSPEIHFVLPSGLFTLHTNDTFDMLAGTMSSEWVWQHATVPPATHSLGAKPVYVVLETNRVANRDRLLLLTPP